MSKVELVEVNTPLNSSSFQHQINQNFEAISNALDNQLQRTEQEDVDNFMVRDLDMNSHKITNLAAPVNPNDAARKQDCDDAEIYAQRAEAAAEVAVEKADIATTAARDAAQDADDADAAKRAAISAAQSSVDAKDAAVIAQGKAEAAETAIRTLLTEDYPEITTVANNIADVNTVATNISDVNSVADNMSDINSVVDNMNDINTVEDNLTSINTNAENIVAIQNASDNAQAAIDAADTAASYAAQMQTMGAMGDIRATMRNTLPPGAIWCDGAEGSLEDYPELKQAIKDGTIPFEALSSWSTYLTNHNNQAPVFFVDATSSGGVVTFNSDSFRAPLMDDVFIEADKDASVPSVIAPGLPNITGSISGITTHGLTCTGAFKAGTSTSTNVTGSGSTWVEQVAEYNASGSDSTFGASNTVQPKAIKYKHYVVVKEYPRIIFVNKPSVNSYNNLPSSGNSIGDTRVVMDTHIIYCWVKTAGGTEAWNSIGVVGESGTPGIYSLNDLLDVDIITPTNGQALVYDSNTGFWINADVDSLPDQAGQGGKFLTTNGTNASWSDVPNTLPSQTGNTGKFLTTDGTNASWAAVPGALPNQEGNAGKALYTNGVNASWKVTRDPNTYRSLSTAQETQLLTDGTYNSETVIDGEIFTCADGSIKEFSDVALPPAILWNNNFSSQGKPVCSNGVDTLAMLDSNGDMYKSTDNGVNWTKTASGLTVAGESGSDPRLRFWYLNNQWILFKSDGTGVQVSTDLVNWNTITFDFGGDATPSYSGNNEKFGFSLAYNGSVYCMAFKNRGNNNRVYYSSDLETWNAPAKQPGIDYVVSVGSDFYGASMRGYYAQSYLFKSTDNGATWTNLYKPTNSRFVQITGDALGNILALGSYGQLYFSSNGGSSWAQITSPVSYTYEQPRVSIVYYDGVWFFAHPKEDGTNGTLLSYTTNLNNWTTSDSGRASSPSGGDDAIYICNGKIVLACGYEASLGIPHEYSLTDLSYNKTSVDTALSGKQDTLTAGTGIDITGNVISATGGGGASSLEDIATAGDGIKFKSGIENYTLYGSPTVDSNYVASNFSENNRILPTMVGFAGQTFANLAHSYPWEFKTKINLTTVGVWNSIFGGTAGSWGIDFYVDSSNKLSMNMSSNGSNYNLANGIQGTTTLSANTDYWLKCGWDGSKYYAELSTDGTNYTTGELSFTSSTPIYSSSYDTYLGFRNQNYLHGSISLPDTSFSFNNGQFEWNVVETGKTVISADIGSGSSAPTSSTVGYVGKLYITSSGAVYICTGVSGSTYTWKQVSVS